MFGDWNLDLTSFCRTVDYHLRTGLSIKSLQSHIDVRKFWQVERKMNTFWAIFVSAILWCSHIRQNPRLWPWPVQLFWTWLWNWIGLQGPWECRIWLRNLLRALWNRLEKIFGLDFGFYRAMNYRSISIVKCLNIVTNLLLTLLQIANSVTISNYDRTFLINSDDLGIFSHLEAD